MTTELTDAERLFIRQKVEKYLAKCMRATGRWVYFSPADCSLKHRNQIWTEVQTTLAVMGVEFEKTTESFSQRKGLKRKPAKYKLRVLNDKQIREKKMFTIPSTKMVQIPLMVDMSTPTKDTTAFFRAYMTKNVHGKNAFEVVEILEEEWRNDS